MKIVMKAVAILMLIVTAVFSTGCGNSSNSVEITKSSDYVDLGLPSGTLWATCNIGAGTPESYGVHFAWGETKPKDTYDWSTYQYCNGSDNTLTKYCCVSEYGFNGFTDSLIVLAPDDDAATVNWGDAWRMPTRDQWNELYQNTDNSWVTQNGVNGKLFTAANGNTLFLPAAGQCWGDGVTGWTVGYSGGYWSSSFGTNTHACCISFCENEPRPWPGSDATGTTFRMEGNSIRPVRSAK